MPGETGHFADRVIDASRRLGHPLCVGLDPHLSLLPPLFRRGSMMPGDPQTAAAVQDFLDALLPRLAGRVAVVKPQIAFFEQLGAAGMQVLQRLIAACRARQLMVLLDAKRGDIGSTADGYVGAYLGPDAPLASDALTVNPYMGLDSLAPFASAAAGHGRGVFVLVRTSNPGSHDFQELVVDGAPLYEHVARALQPDAERLRGPATGFSALGVVVGATRPEQARRVRALLPATLMLVPGFGAQGADAARAVSGFVPGPAGLEGGLVNSSRGITFPADGATDAAEAWERAIDRALDEAIDTLGNAVHG